MSQKTSILNEYLVDLAKGYYTDLNIILKSKILLKVYDGEFRHSYSQILATIWSIKESNDPKIDFLAFMENINMLKLHVIDSQEGEFLRIRPSLEKLYDHVELEIARIGHFERISDMQNDFEVQLRTANNNLNSLQNSIETASKQTECLKVDIITVIGVFAAIMLAFVSGMTFTSSVLTSMHSSSIYKVAFESVICGFVVFNTIFSLLYFIGRITGKDLYSKCADGECVHGTCTKKCDIRIKMKKRLPYVYWVNFCLISLLILIFISWFIEIKTISDFVRSKLFNLLN